MNKKLNKVKKAPKQDSQTQNLNQKIVKVYDI